jgi:D(-)-tartrate dehydratase
VEEFSEPRYGAGQGCANGIGLQRGPGERGTASVKITRIREATAPIASEIRNAFISFSTMTVSLVAVETDVVRDGRAVVGYGFTSNGRYAQGGILRERFIPRVMAADARSLVDAEADNLDPLAVWKAFMANEKPGGHGDRAHAAGGLDMAVWDAVARIAGKPLWRLLAERYNGGRFDERVLVYPGGGYYYPGKEIEGLKAEMRGYQEQGYRIVKMKIGGADLATDIRRIEAVLGVVGTGANLAVDANGRFGLETALAYGKAMQPYGLFWYEEPGDPLDFQLNAVLAEHYGGALATGENLFSVIDGRNLLRYGGLRPDRDWVQLDPALSYGLTEYLRFVEAAETMGWSRRRLIPHGGHQLALNIAAGLQTGGSESYPGVFQPYGGFADNIPIVDGYARLPEEPGIGMELRPKMFAEMRRRLEFE